MYIDSPITHHGGCELLPQEEPRGLGFLLENISTPLGAQLFGLEGGEASRKHEGLPTVDDLGGGKVVGGGGFVGLGARGVHEAADLNVGDTADHRGVGSAASQRDVGSAAGHRGVIVAGLHSLGIHVIEICTYAHGVWVIGRGEMSELTGIMVAQHDNKRQNQCNERRQTEGQVDGDKRQTDKYGTSWRHHTNVRAGA